MYTQEKLDALELLNSLGNLPKNNYDEGQPIRIIIKEEKKPEIFNKVIEKSNKILEQQNKKKEEENKKIKLKQEKINNIKELAEKGLYAEEIAKELNCSKQEVYVIGRKNNIQIKKDYRCRKYQNKNKINIDIDKLKELIEKGLTQDEIAKELNTTQFTISKNIKLNNIKYKRHRSKNKVVKYKTKTNLLIDKQKVEQLLREGKSRKKISKLFSVSEKCFYDWCENNFDNLENKRFSYKLEGKDELIKDLFYKKGYNKKRIIEYLNCSNETFYKYIKLKNIVLKEKEEKQNNYCINTKEYIDNIKRFNSLNKKIDYFNRKTIKNILKHRYYSKKYGAEEIRILKNKHKDMLRKCYCEHAKDYSVYGKRGIKVCEEWKNNIYKFIEWSMNNGYKLGLSINRIDGEGDYEPNNCEYVEKDYNDLWQKGKLYGHRKYKTSELFYKAKRQINFYTVRSRIKAGWDEDKILNTPVKKRTITDKYLIFINNFFNDKAYKKNVRKYLKQCEEMNKEPHWGLIDKRFFKN